MDNFVEVEYDVLSGINWPKNTIIPDVGFAEEANPSYREQMEDAHVMGYMPDGNSTFFAVYDGHGGVDASLLAAECLHAEFFEALSSNRTIKNSFEIAFKRTDDIIEQEDVCYKGTTAVCLYIHKDASGTKRLDVAHVGDSFAVVFSQLDNNRGYTANNLTPPHRPSDPAERTMITQRGGYIVFDRVNSILSVTRALGDFGLKPPVSGEPVHATYEIGPNDKWIIVACDGLWDFVDLKEVAEILKRCETASEAASSLKALALDCGTSDNVSVIALKLQ
eukprot:TRINITY_DN2924_c0_g1_i1.p1 TRINITY_DN2924_c0_g1~~TRINITY_DN2924_c0_g1_i1.p1  ORF type:complete len:278 (+),score=91.45 TRINITY_DN2924_c0_g1_i1:42-875(+)